MRRRIGFLGVVLFLLGSASVWAGGLGAGADGCPKSLEKAALEVASTDILDWADLYAVYLRFLPCDDGAIAEGFSDIVVRTLAHKWASLGKLGNIAKKDPGFLRFVYTHIDATTDPQDLQRIRDNLKKPGCPKSSANVCRGIELAVTQAQEEM